jgi:hypothetical protein
MMNSQRDFLGTFFISIDGSELQDPVLVAQRLTLFFHGYATAVWILILEIQFLSPSV